jgi:hypothetical protein
VTERRAGPRREWSRGSICHGGRPPQGYGQETALSGGLVAQAVPAPPGHSPGTAGRAQPRGRVAGRPERRGSVGCGRASGRAAARPSAYARMIREVSDLIAGRGNGRPGGLSRCRLLCRGPPVGTYSAVSAFPAAPVAGDGPRRRRISPDMCPPMVADRAGGRTVLNAEQNGAREVFVSPDRCRPARHPSGREPSIMRAADAARSHRSRLLASTPWGRLPTGRIAALPCMVDQALGRLTSENAHA